MKKLCVFLVVVVFFGFVSSQLIAWSLSYNSAKAFISPKFDLQKHKDVAIVESNDVEVSDAFTGELMTMGFNVLDRKHVQKILKELQFGQTGLTDTTKVKQAGKLVGAGAFVTIRLVPSQFPSLAFTMIDVETGSILMTCKNDFKGGVVPNKTDLVESLMKAIKDELEKKK